VSVRWCEISYPVEVMPGTLAIELTLSVCLDVAERKSKPRRKQEESQRGGRSERETESENVRVSRERRHERLGGKRERTSARGERERERVRATERERRERAREERERKRVETTKMKVTRAPNFGGSISEHLPRLDKPALDQEQREPD